MKEKQSTTLWRQRRMLLVMPLLVLPFITMAFWALGGGRGTDNKTSTDSTGLNLRLPDAKLKDDRNADKLSFYKAADADSLKRREIMSNDPYYKDINCRGAGPAQLNSIKNARYSRIKKGFKYFSI